MKIALFLFMCSSVANNCLPPHQTSELHNSWYDCMLSGYQESLDKTIEIGKEDINEHEIFIRFACIEEKIILPKAKPKVET